MNATAKTNAPFGLEAWVDKLGEMKVVSLSGIISELNRLTASEESSVPQLSEVILRDPALTSKVIRVANSAIYNPGGQPITTISRAVMHIGFNTVRAICVSTLVMESLLEKHPREGLIRQMARSFHAAIQARNFCEKLRPDVKEEVFVAALLMHLGKLLIWAYPHGVSDKAYELEMAGAPASEVEALLGTTPTRITQEIARQWHLGDTLKQVLNTAPEDQDRRAKAVVLGDEVSRAIEQGVGSEKMKELLRRVAELMDIPVSRAQAKIEGSLKEAQELSREYNDPRITRLIERTRQPSSQGATDSEDASSDSLRQPNPKLQLETLQEIIKMMSEGIDSPKLFSLVMKGLQEGVGLERVALLLLNQQRTQVVGKFFLGPGTGTWKNRFAFVYEASPKNLFSRVMQEGQPIRLQDGEPGDLSRYLPPAMEEITHTRTIVLAPLKANRREVGFLYADMGISQRLINAEYLTGFKHFCQQANLCLTVLANRR